MTVRSEKPFISLAGVEKRFGTLAAVTGANLDLYEGEIHALVGENGAGKSTLMHMLSGLMSPDSGEIRIDSAAVRFRDPYTALTAGIGMVHQTPALFEELSIIENLDLGVVRGRGSVTRNVLRRRVDRLFARYDLALDCDAPVSELSDAEREFVALVGLLLLPLRLRILDEPTASFSAVDEHRYFRMVTDAAKAGSAFVFITHKLKEVSHIAGRVTIIRKGRTVYTGVVAERGDEEIRNLMFGNGDAVDSDRSTAPLQDTSDSSHVERRLDLQSEERQYDSPPGTESTRCETAMELRRIDFVKGGVRRLGHVSVTVPFGKIVVVSGIRESGPADLEAVCTGSKRASGGVIELAGRRYEQLSQAILRRNGVGYVPTDRYRTATVSDARIWENLALSRRVELARRGLLDGGSIEHHTSALLERAGVAAQDGAKISSLSGGMLQRIVLVREIDAAERLLIISEPFLGLDVSSRARTKSQLVRLAQSGTGVLAFVSDVDDAVYIADVIVILKDGRVTATLDRKPFDRNEIADRVLGMETVG